MPDAFLFGMKQKNPKLSPKKKLDAWTKHRKKEFHLTQAKYLLSDEFYLVNRMLQNQSTCETDFRNKLILRLLLSTGARASEMLALRPQDFNLNTRTIYIRGLKGSNDREMPLKYRLFCDLKRYAKSANGKYLFPIDYHRLRDIWEAYTPVPKKLHCLRHTFAIRLFRATFDLRLVQVALGHKSIKNTMVYSEYHYSQEEMKRILVVSV